MTPEELLQDYDDEVQALANHLRALILDTVPDFSERAYPGWRGIGFRHPRAGYVCGLFPREPGVRLLFEKGVQLYDPTGVFSGGGRQTRHIDIIAGAPIPEAAIRALLLQAINL